MYIVKENNSKIIISLHRNIFNEKFRDDEKISYAKHSLSPSERPRRNNCYYKTKCTLTHTHTHKHSHRHIERGNAKRVIIYNIKLFDCSIGLVETCESIANPIILMFEFKI